LGKEVMKRPVTIIYFRAFNMSHEKRVSTKKPMTLISAVYYIEKKYGETAIVEKIKVGIEIIYNPKYKPFMINTNYSRGLMKNK
jgi:hypothetical protein